MSSKTYGVHDPRKDKNTDEVVRLAFARNLTELLEARHISRRELAKRTGDSHATISRAAKGDKAVSICALARIANALRVSPDRLLSVNRAN